MPLKHRAARKFQTVLAAAELEGKWVQTAFGTKITTWESSDGYHRARLLVPKLVEWEEKFTISSSVFSSSTEGAELCAEVFVLCFYLGAPWTPAGRAQSCCCQASFIATLMVGFPVAAPSLDLQNGPRPNSFLPSGVLSWLLNFLKIPFQITSFFPCPTFCPSSPVPGTFYSGIFHQTCLLNFSICHSVEVVLSHMLKNTWYCSTNNAIQTYRHPFTGVYLGFFRKSELQYA